MATQNPQRNGNGNGQSRDRDRDDDARSSGMQRTDYGRWYGDESRDDRADRQAREQRQQTGYRQGGEQERDGQRDPAPGYNQYSRDNDRDWPQGREAQGRDRAPMGHPWEQASDWAEGRDRGDRGRGDWGQYDDGRVTYGRRDENQGFRSARSLDDADVGPQGRWNTEDRFGRRDEYQSNQDRGGRGGWQGGGQSGYGSGYRGTPRGSDEPSNRGNYGQQSSYGPQANDGRQGNGGDRASRGPSGNYGMGARDAERADQQRRSFRGVGPQGYTRSDSRIEEDINDCFTHDHDLDAGNITVKVANGEVTLTGTVDDRGMKYHAEELAERIGGVKEVDNQIRVQRAGSRGASTASTSTHEPGSSTSGTLGAASSKKPSA